MGRQASEVVTKEIRVPKADWDLWARAAKAAGVFKRAFIVAACNAAAKAILKKRGDA